MKYDHIVNVLDVWEDYTGEGDKFYCAIVDIGYGKIYVEYEVEDVEKLVKNPKDNELQNAIACLVIRDWDKYYSLPKINETSSLLQCCFNNVMTSDSNMFFIDSEEWRDFYCTECGYDNHDLEMLEKEIVKYGLQDVIVMYDYDLITCYGDLRFKFMYERV